MTAESIFQLCNTIALAGWLILILVSPLWFRTDRLLVGLIITLFAIVYTWLIFSGFKPADMANFRSLEGVMSLFMDKTVVTAGWVHYLAFDLLAGVWIRKNSLYHGINQWLVLPCLLLTFMFGPMGLLLYLVIRWIITKRYFAEN
jgi:hypothetical protein